MRETEKKVIGIIWIIVNAMFGLLGQVEDCDGKWIKEQLQFNHILWIMISGETKIYIVLIYSFAFRLAIDFRVGLEGCVSRKISSWITYVHPYSINVRESFFFAWTRRTLWLDYFMIDMNPIFHEIFIIFCSFWSYKYEMILIGFKKLGFLFFFKYLIQLQLWSHKKLQQCTNTPPFQRQKINCISSGQLHPFPPETESEPFS